MKTYAVLLTLEDHPNDTGQHAREDTILNDVVQAITERGYENVTIISSDRH